MAADDASRLVTRPGRAARHDFAAIAQWIRPGAHVLDLGCGDGTLLRALRETRAAHGYGIEIDDARIIASVRNGVNVIQSDLESGLSGFESSSFDYVILSQTLQAVRHTERIVKEMLRVGREGIVTFPNFGFWRHRLQIFGGRLFKDRVFHRVQRVDRRARVELPPDIEGFRTRRINFTFRYVPVEHVVPFQRLGKQAQEDVRGYVTELARSSGFFRRALTARA